MVGVPVSPSRNEGANMFAVGASIPAVLRRGR